MDLKEVVAINLRRLRHAKGMTQETLAERAGLSARYVGGIERADVSASVTVLGRIADALEVEATELQIDHERHRIGLSLTASNDGNAEDVVEAKKANASARFGTFADLLKKR